MLVGLVFASSRSSPSSRERNQRERDQRVPAPNGNALRDVAVSLLDARSLLGEREKCFESDISLFFFFILIGKIAMDVEKN